MEKLNDAGSNPALGTKFKIMRLGKQKTTPHKGNIFQQELELKEKAKELSKNRKEDKPIKYLLKR